MHEEDIRRLLKKNEPVAYVAVEGIDKSLFREWVTFWLWVSLVAFVVFFTLWFFNLI